MSGAALASQRSAWRVAAVSVPVVHEDVVRVMHEDPPLTVNALTHVGWHMSLEATAALLLPTFVRVAFVGEVALLVSRAVPSEELLLDGDTSRQ